MTTFTDVTPMVTVHAGHHNELAAAVDNLQGLVGNSVLSGTWRWTSSTTDASASGRVGLNQATWAAATQLNLNEITLAGGDATNVLAKLKVGDGFYLQDQADASKWARYTISGTQVDQGTWRQFPVTFVDGSEPPPANNADTVVTLTVQGGTSAALDLKVDKDAVTAAATRVVANMLAAGDAQPAWRVLGSGQMEWGAGGATAPDVTLSRGAAGTLYLGSTAQRGALRQFGGATTDVLSDFRVTTDANARWSVQADGRMFWGPGNAAQDVNLYRSGAATIRTDNNFTVGNFATFLNIAAVTRSLPADCLYIKATGDAQPRISLVNSPRIDFGAGGSTAVDTNLYRGAADRLKTDDLFDATTLALATKVKAGTPVDADWAVAPPDGTIVADSTGNKLWVRVGGVWKGVVVA